MSENLNSHHTAKEREKMSFPTRILLERKLFHGKILDFGCGFGKDVEELNAKGIDIIGFDPYYQPDYPKKKFNTIICHYVLNVLKKQEQAKVLFEVSRLLKFGGKAYFSVRRDIKKQGFRTHFIHKVKTYQTNVVLPFKSVYKNENVEIYEYQHYCFLNQNKADVSPFFERLEPKEQVGELASCFAFKDKYPVSKGHSLVIPKRVVSSYFDLTFKEQSACWFLVNLVKAELQKTHQADGFNIGINSGIAAGQTVMHCHIHIIPRYQGDIKNPRGGIRGIIPKKKDY
ncbi:HIT family protein [Mesohalobacter halotolerans]|uniref:HIT domain-containing protein n=1 Tax=Mesohalobacter halotolerans TaxID=1883405 RepID=A0A4V6ALJ0_9FLAO|nr:HIT family protein [Mesohalobacter halotolerans]TKS57085.1 HIT domain-containing protein [Mesohalobacter halotolerans]